MHVSTKTCTLITSGSIITLKHYRDIIRVPIIIDDFHFSVEFTVSGGEGRPSVSASTTNGILHLVCNNFASKVGSGNTAPIPIGSYKGRQIYLNFWVLSLGNEDAYQVTYTVFMEGV